MIEALRLEDLGALDRSRLHIFVVGPGVGEAIAVALPVRDWFLLDGCMTSGGQVPILEIWDRWRLTDDRVAGYMLTHPHNDHALGAARIIERTDPARISVGPLDVLRQEAGSLALGDATSGLRLGQAVRSALIAVDTWSARHPDGLIEPIAGSAWPMARTEVLITQWAPLQTTIDWLRDASVAGAFPTEQANRGSTVLELEFGQTRVVLGGDLPSFASAQDRESRRPLTGGWFDVLTVRAKLGAHAALKVPHHGSDEAIHEGLMPRGTGRAWITTPFNTGGKALPSLVAMGGLEWMVNQNGLVHLTSPPASRQAPIRISASGRVLLQELAPFARRGPFASALRVHTPAPPIAALDPVWCVRFDDRGRIDGRWRGDRAFAVTPP